MSDTSRPPDYMMRRQQMPPLPPMQQPGAPMPIQPKPPNPPPPALQPSEKSLLEQLERIVSADQPIPEVGIQASNGMKNAYEIVAADIERLAQESVDRAMLLQSESRAFAAIIRENGAKLCEKIENEAKRGYQISSVMKSASMLLQHAENRKP